MRKSYGIIIGHQDYTPEHTIAKTRHSLANSIPVATRDKGHRLIFFTQSSD